MLERTCSISAERGPAMAYRSATGMYTPSAKAMWHDRYPRTELSTVRPLAAICVVGWPCIFRTLYSCVD